MPPGAEPPAPPQTVVPAQRRRWHPLAWLATLILPVVLFGGAGIAVAFAIGAIQPEPITPQSLFAFVALVSGPIVVGILLFARWVLRAHPSELGLTRPQVADLRYGLVFGTGLFLAGAAIGLVQTAAGGREPQAVVQALLRHSGPGALALNLISVALLTPIFEELLFRGVLQGGLRQRFPFLVSALIATAAFTVVHERSVWITVFVLGFGLALAYERRRNLWAPIATHATVNAIPVLLIGLGLAGP